VAEERVEVNGDELQVSSEGGETERCTEEVVRDDKKRQMARWDDGMHV